MNFDFALYPRYNLNLAQKDIFNVCYNEINLKLSRYVIDDLVREIEKFYKPYFIKGNLRYFTTHWPNKQSMLNEENSIIYDICSNLNSIASLHSNSTIEFLDANSNHQTVVNLPNLLNAEKFVINENRQTVYVTAHSGHVEYIDLQTCTLCESPKIKHNTYNGHSLAFDNSKQLLAIYDGVYGAIKLYDARNDHKMIISFKTGFLEKDTCGATGKNIPSLKIRDGITYYCDFNNNLIFNNMTHRLEFSIVRPNQSMTQHDCELTNDNLFIVHANNDDEIIIQTSQVKYGEIEIEKTIDITKLTSDSLVPSGRCSYQTPFSFDHLKCSLKIFKLEDYLVIYNNGDIFIFE